MGLDEKKEAVASFLIGGPSGARSATQATLVAVPLSRHSLKTVHWTVFLTLRSSPAHFIRKNKNPRLFVGFIFMVDHRGLEPRTIRLRVGRSTN